MPDEWLQVCDERGRPIGRERRSVCHGRPEIIHAVVHVVVTNAAGEMLLQKRGPSKDVEPGKWDTAVGGHLSPGERPADAARREMLEELGVSPSGLLPAYTYLIRTSIETEFVHSFVCSCEGPFHPDAQEIETVRFWPLDTVAAALGDGVFTPNFEAEYERWLAWTREKAG